MENINRYLVCIRAALIAVLLSITISTFAQTAATDQQCKNEVERLKKELVVTKQHAEKVEALALRGRYIALAKEMVHHSSRFKDPDLRALMSIQAYNFNLNRGYRYDDDIYRALYQSLAKFKDPIIENLPDSINRNVQSPGKMEAMIAALCSHLKRNFSAEEWRTLVTADLPYEKTCSNLPENNK